MSNLERKKITKKVGQLQITRCWELCTAHSKYRGTFEFHAPMNIFYCVDDFMLGTNYVYLFRLGCGVELKNKGRTLR